MLPKISAIVLTKNSEKTIKRALESLKTLDEVIVLDTGSTDHTKQIVATFSNVRLYEHHFTGFGAMRTLATSYASHDWVLSLDSDEQLSKHALKEIEETSLDPRCVYSFPFHNYFNEKHIKWCGWYPDRHIRLFNKTETGFSSDFVHERILSEGFFEKKCHFPILHYSYQEISDFLEKMQRYTTLFAQQNQYKKTSSLSKALFHAGYAFMKSYFLQKGFMGGVEGFIIASYNSQTAYYKYLKLWEANRNARCP